MFRLTVTAAATAVALLGVFVSYAPEADAEDPHLGVIEYEISCMPCHGVEGHGDGRLPPALKIRPADLTKIADRRRRGGGANATLPRSSLCSYSCRVLLVRTQGFTPPLAGSCRFFAARIRNLPQQ
jgi:hypothetical protein